MIGVVFLKNLHSICHGVACYPEHLLEELGIQKNVHRFYSERDLHLFTV